MSQAKKQKRTHDPSASTASFIATHHPEKPSARAKPSKKGGKNWTISVAIPGSIVKNAQTKELRAWLAGQRKEELSMEKSLAVGERGGPSHRLPPAPQFRKKCIRSAFATLILYHLKVQSLKTQHLLTIFYEPPQIARTCAIFTVSEIIVYRDPSSDNATPSSSSSYKPRGKYRDTEAGSNGHGQGQGGNWEEEEDGTDFLARLLGYLETPQYLRKALFPLHPSLRLAGLLPPLDCPHHLRRDDESEFREGVVVRKGLVDIGGWDPIELRSGGGLEAKEGERVTVRMPEREGGGFATLVPSSLPTTSSGLYWGYKVRVANSLAQVFSECPYDDGGDAGAGYDVSVGTSERGTGMEEFVEELDSGDAKDFRHLLLTLGPLSGLELSIAADPLIPLEASDAADLFDYWVNVVEGQGSRTVRTEEALGIALSRVWRGVESRG